MEKIINNLTFSNSRKIVQTPDNFKFCIDSILLANFVSNIKETSTIVDLGTGNAPVLLYLSIKYNNKMIGVELQKSSYDLAIDSINENKLNEQLTIMNDNLIDIHKKIGLNKYDVVISNPPYFKYDETKNIKINLTESIARHEIEVDFEKIVVESKRLLKNKGYLYLIHKTSRYNELVHTLKKHNFNVKTVRFVHSFIDRESNVVLIEARKVTSQDEIKVLKPLIIYNSDQEYTDEVNKILSI